MANLDLEQGQIRERLVHAMGSRRMNQVDLIRATGLSGSYVSALIGGRRPLSPSLTPKLAAALGISLAWLETGDGHMDDVESFATPGVNTGHADSGALSLDQVGKLLAAAERERLTPDERALLAKYQSLPPAQRARLWALLEAGAADPPEPPATMVNEAERGKGKGGT